MYAVSGTSSWLKELSRSTKLIACSILLIAATGCGSSYPLSDGGSLLSRAQQAWLGDWHAVWQIEWEGAPVRGPLVIEVWHAADGRWRVETLEAPTAALSGLTLVNDGETSYLYDLRQDQVETGSDKGIRIPLASDALDAIEWLVRGTDHLSATTAGRDTLESGLATRIDIELNTGGQAVIWVDDETRLPAQVKLRSEVWGEATFATRSINLPEQLPSALFTLP